MGDRYSLKVNYIGGDCGEDHANSCVRLGRSDHTESFNFVWVLE